MRKTIWVIVAIAALFWWVIWCAVFYVAGKRSATGSDTPARATGALRGEFLSRMPARRESFTLSSDELHVAYVKVHPDGRQVFVDGKAEPIKSDIIERSLVFSPDGLRLGYVAYENEKYV